VINDIIVIDDLLPESYSSEIQNTLYSPDFPWYYADDITYGQNAGELEKTFGFFHLFYTNGQRISPFGSYIEPLYHIALDKANVKVTDSRVLQARSFLQTPNNTTRKYNNKHVDTTIPHVVVLYYVNDSDGDTHLFNGVDIIKTVTPKKNRVVIFDGSIYHSSGSPTTNKRCVINFNIIGEYNV
jgi:hypothetical protein